jgi:hypothetical protein
MGSGASAAAAAGEQEQPVLSHHYLGAIVRAGERGCHARDHAARACAGPAEWPDVLLISIHLRWQRWVLLALDEETDRGRIKRTTSVAAAVEQVRRLVDRKN